jgi:hypothetical protein
MVADCESSLLMQIEGEYDGKKLNGRQAYGAERQPGGPASFSSTGDWNDLGSLC